MEREERRRMRFLEQEKNPVGILVCAHDIMLRYACSFVFKPVPVQDLDDKRAATSCRLE